jgi:hypothetical protein
MFDDLDQRSPAGFGAVRKGDAMDRTMALTNSAEPTGRRPGKLDSPKVRALHGRLMAYYERELHRQTENRAQMALDDDFYDNEQWSDADKATLKDRGQVPLVYNVISTAVNWITGTEKRGRSDFKILPRRKDAAKAAERKTQLFKYLSDQSMSEFHRSRAFEDATKVGIGWLECGWEDESDAEPIYDRYLSWRCMLWDSASVNHDLTDCRYVFKVKWVDLDIAIALFPDREKLLIESAEDGDGYANGSDLMHGDDPMDSQEDAIDEDAPGVDTAAYSRKRVRIIEGWFRMPIKGSVMRGGDFAGEVFDPHSPGHTDSMANGRARTVSRTIMRMHCAFMTARGMLYVDESPYRHNAYPQTPIWCYRRGRDNMPYGVIRGLRSIQEDINKRAAKALHILSTNKTIMDEGAVDDLDAYLEEVSRPDAVIVKKPGKELVINAERELAPAHLDMMARSIQMVQQVSGVTDEAMGRTTNAVAGVAIKARQTQAGMATAGLFDNLRRAVQIHGGKRLSVMEQFLTEEKAFRITNMRGTPEYVTVNDGMPENDIARSKADFIISEDDWRASVREAAVAELMDVLVKMAPAAPQLAMVMLDLVVESMDIPNRDEIVKRIRQVTGMRDPDAEQASPEEMAQAAQKQKQEQMQEAAAMAEIAERKARAALLEAQAKKAMADIDAAVATTVGTKVTAQKTALEAALAALSTPPAAPVADLILHESGFASRTESEADERARGILEGEAMQAQQAQAEQEAAMAQQQQAAMQQGAQAEQAMGAMNPSQREAAQRELAAAAQQQAPGLPPQGA